jgi:hypothetical protein
LKHFCAVCLILLINYKFHRGRKHEACKLLLNVVYVCTNVVQGPPGAKGEVGDSGPPGRDGIDGKVGAPGPPVSKAHM